MRFPKTIGALAVGAVIALTAPVPGEAAGQPVRSFATPEAAIDALIAALRAPTIQPTEEIFGREVLDSVPPEERRSDAARREAGERLAAESRKIVFDDDQHTRAHAVIGSEDFKLPTPLVLSGGMWVFDGAAGVAEMNKRRIAVNEENAIRALHALARAEEIYRERDRQGHGVLEYAGRIRGSDGRRDGLVNPEADEPPGPTVSLLNEAFARAEGRPGDPEHHPFGGYGYAMLTAQGASAEGGARSYLSNGHLLDGYAVVAWPTRPGITGESTFIMNQLGVIYEQELGDSTLETVQQMTAFDPGEKWTRVDE
jgi:hypothetical protein